MDKYKKLLFIINPKSGMQKKENPLSEIIITFSEYGYETIVCFTKKAGDATTLVKNHANDDIDLIVCMGGDGTLNETFAGALAIGWDKNIGYIPAGSTNDFASSLGIPKDPIEAAEKIMTGHPWKIDLGEFNGRTFVYTACCGIFTKTSYATPQHIKNRLGHFAYVLEGIKDFTQIHHIKLKITTPQTVLDDEFIFVAICNTFSIGGVMSLDESDVELDDGYFELLAIRRPKDLIQLNSTILALYEQNFENAELIHFEKIEKAKIEFPDAEDWSLDGERGNGRVNNTFKVLPEAISLVY